MTLVLRPFPSVAAGASPTVSVVLPTKKARRVFGGCLTQVSSQRITIMEQAGKGRRAVEPSQPVSKLIECLSASGSRNLSNSFPSLVSWLLAEEGRFTEGNGVKGAADFLHEDFHVPATNPSTRNVGRTSRFLVVTFGRYSSAMILVRSACERIRLSKAATKRTGAGVASGGRGASGRSKSSRFRSSRKVTSFGRSLSSKSRPPVMPDQA